jgi:mRNA-degrading endonuclease RelE of RelBE toxin-antitoxin system
VAEAAPWSLTITPHARRDLRNLPPAERTHVILGIEALRQFPHAGDLRRLTDQGDLWRLRIGERRIRFLPDAATHTIAVLRVLPRDRAYR